MMSHGLNAVSKASQLKESNFAESLKDSGFKSGGIERKRALVTSAWTLP